MHLHLNSDDDLCSKCNKMVAPQLKPCKDDECLHRQVNMSASAVEVFLRAIPGENPGREGLKETPNRYARAFAELTSGYNKKVDQEVGEALFGEVHDGMVLQTDIPVYSLCEHHLLPFFGHAHIAYIPNSKIGIIGLSKFKRIIEIFTKRLQVQERLTTEIADVLDRLLQPHGLAVVVTCRHMCMEMRGVVCQGTTTTTSQRRGVFHEPRVFQEFLLLMNTSKMNEQPIRISDNAQSPSTSCCPDKREREERLVQSEGMDTTLHYPTKHCDDYRLYLKCIEDEMSRIAKAVEESVMGPLSQKKPHGISILDVGAGNGAVLKELHSCTGIKIARYAAYEMDASLCHELQSTAASLGYDDQNARIFQLQFSLQTTAEEFGGHVDVVVLSHCLYGMSLQEKLNLIDHALQFLSTGGILLIFHRWEEEGSLNSISKTLTSKSLLHNLCIWESHLCLSNLDAAQRVRLNRYTKGVVLVNEQQTSAVRLVGCIAIEPDSCDLRNKEKNASLLEETRQQVAFLAKKKKPSVVVKPNTVIGIQTCLRAASLQTLGSSNVTVIGGGHSENAFADDAIAINMQLWNNVEVDLNNRLVKIGGGAKSGEILKQCEKHSLMVPLGDRPGVGAGLLLQGGLNHFMRRYGLATDNILKVVYVNPEGMVQEATTDEELFPFRGAGSNFGVVVELTVKAFSLNVVTAQDILYLLPKDSYKQVLKNYSETADSLPDTACLDGFLFWSGPDQLTFATSHFDTSSSNTSKDSSTKCLLFPFQEVASVGEETSNTPSQLYHRELYMTDLFAPHRVMVPSQVPPCKLRSNKRCLFLPLLTEEHESILSRLMHSAPTKWCYVHLLHGGKAVAQVEPAKTAFGCRDWTFAAVITARWPDGESETERLATQWLELALSLLLPHSKGVYGSDLGIKDKELARRAFGRNTLRLARMKQESDPLNILGCACPISADEDPRVQARGIVVIFCGRRCSGKDWLASIAHSTLSKMKGGLSEIVSISDETKREYARENPSVDVTKLLSNRWYKDSHRKALTAFYQRKCAQDVAYDAKCYVKVVQRSDDGRIVLLTGMRDGLDYARRLAGKPVVMVKVVSSNEAKQARGWAYDADIDLSKGECSVDTKDTTFWDAVYDNDLNSTPRSAEEWTKDILVPCIFKRCTRSLPNTPQPGVQYRDVLGSLLLQPFAMTLWTASVIHWMDKNGQASNLVDAIVAPEAVGFAFASPIAAYLKKPLILLRKGGKLMGDTDVAWYGGSNIRKMTHTCCQGEGMSIKNRNDCCCLEILSGAIVPGQRILVVDDCLASGSTLRAVLDLVRYQGGVVTKMAVLLELPDLSGRPDDPVDIFCMMKFLGN